MTSTAPDYPLARIGWRVWSVRRVEGSLRLASLLYETTWEPGREVAAVCRRPLAMLPWSRQPLHDPPNADCVCGIYGVRTAAHAVPFLRAEADSAAAPVHRVLGRVSLWGRVVEGPWGFRAASGYPERLLVPPLERQGLRRFLPLRPSRDEIVDGLAVYGVPVEPADRLDLEEGLVIRL